jgi:hypothetical protein
MATYGNHSFVESKNALAAEMIEYCRRVQCPTLSRLLQIEERVTASAKPSQLANIWIKASEAQESKPRHA